MQAIKIWTFYTSEEGEKPWKELVERYGDVTLVSHTTIWVPGVHEPGRPLHTFVVSYTDSRADIPRGRATDELLG